MRTFEIIELPDNDPYIFYGLKVGDRFTTGLHKGGYGDDHWSRNPEDIQGALSPMWSSYKSLCMLIDNGSLFMYVKEI